MAAWHTLYIHTLYTHTHIHCTHIHCTYIHCTYIRTYTHTLYIHTYTLTHIHTYTHAHMHTYTHTLHTLTCQHDQQHQGWRLQRLQLLLKMRTAWRHTCARLLNELHRSLLPRTHTEKEERGRTVCLDFFDRVTRFLRRIVLSSSYHHLDPVGRNHVC